MRHEVRQSARGVAALADALGTNCTLTELDLEGNRLGESVVIITETLRENPDSALRALCLDDNALGTQALHAIAEMLEEGTPESLTSLGLQANGIEASHDTQLARRLGRACAGRISLAIADGPESRPESPTSSWSMLTMAREPRAKLTKDRDAVIAVQVVRAVV